MIQVPTLDELIRGGWARVTLATGVTNASESGLAHSIVAAMASYVLDLYNEMSNAEQQSNLSTAIGENLDALGAFYGVVRLLAQQSTTLGGPSSVLFTNNSGIAQVIPSGTRVWTPSDTNRAYFTTVQISVPPGGQAYADVIAAAAGSYYNSGVGTVTSTSLNNSAITLTNILPISSGSNVETDANYRTRIASNVARREGPSLVAVREAILDIPGVRDVTLQNLVRGTGTVDALVLGWDRDVSLSLLAEVQAVLDRTVAVGVSAIAKGPIVRFVDVDIYLNIKLNGDVTGAQNAAVAAAHGMLDNLPIEDGTQNGSVLYSALAARVQQAHTDILTSTVTLTVDSLPSLRGDQRANFGERFVARAIVAH